MKMGKANGEHVLHQGNNLRINGRFPVSNKNLIAKQSNIYEEGKVRKRGFIYEIP